MPPATQPQFDDRWRSRNQVRESLTCKNGHGRSGTHTRGTNFKTAALGHYAIPPPASLPDSPPQAVPLSREFAGQSRDRRRGTSLPELG